MWWYWKDGTPVNMYKNPVRGDVDENELNDEFKELSNKLGDAEYKRVAKTDVGEGDKGYWVSTVWLGLDQSFGMLELDFDKPNPNPVIFETMVFENKLTKSKPGKIFPKGYSYQKSLDDFTRRYSTEEEAKQGHEEVVKEVHAMVRKQRKAEKAKSKTDVRPRLSD